MAHQDRDNRSQDKSSNDSSTMDTRRSSGNQDNTPDRNSDGTFRSDDDR